MNDSTALAGQEGWPPPPNTPPPAPVKPYASDRDVLATCIVGVAREFADRAPLGRSITRTHNLYHRCGLSLDQFIDVVTAARAIAQERCPTVDNGLDTNGRTARMQVFFTVLEELLGQTLPVAESSENEGAGDADGDHLPSAGSSAST